ncbi:uncharacterized protein KZ484_021860 isoform 2-T3 [Pholidichthys leucotaenia]
MDGEDLTEEHVYQRQNQKLCDQENLQPPQIKEEQVELHPETSYFKEEHKELNPETSTIKEEEDEIHPELLDIKVVQVELHPEPLNIKEEQDDPCSSPDGQQFVLNHESDRSSIIKSECEGIFLEDEPKHQLDVAWNPETRLHRKGWSVSPPLRAPLTACCVFTATASKCKRHTWNQLQTF